MIMKKQLIPFITFIAGGFILSSCNNLSSLSITKRHYRSGYYVDFGQRKLPSSALPGTAKLSIKTIDVTKPLAITTNQNNPSTVSELKTPEIKPIVPQKNALKEEEVKFNKTTSNISISNSGVQNLSSATFRSNEAESEVQARVDVDVPLVVIILCAIFIPPLGVGLMYGIHSYFWIDLLLTFLFFIPGMIFALVVVLM
jgi:uncharacterized membrane protein YqaE (UPF0057 family)